MEGHRTAGMLIVDGMSCAHCEQRIESAVGALVGVLKVRASAPLCEVRVSYDPGKVSFEAIADAIRGAGYSIRGDGAAARQTAAGPDPAAIPVCAAVPARPATLARPATPARPAAQKSRASSLYRFLGLLAVIAAAYFVLRSTVGFTFLPSVSQSMGYGLLFVVGLLTSLHCIAMCGGIVLSQAGTTAAPKPGAGARLVPSLLYNAGRIVSYTVIGGIVGSLGSLFSLSTALKGAMPVVAGAFMLFLGVRMLGIIPWLSRLKVRFPGIGGSRLASAAAGRGPFVIGLLNGLMPCGPLQTMQVYALGTGSLFAGALSMFVFSVGTVPLLLGFGAISSFLNAKFNRRMVMASGVLVAALGLVMFTRGLNLYGVAMPSVQAPAQTSGAAIAKLENGYQVVSSTVEASRYQPLVVQAGIPVRWTITVKAADLNGCNNPVTVPQYGIRARLVPGDNLIQFTPDRAGNITYTCWMGMIVSTIRVVPDLARMSAQDFQKQNEEAFAGAGISADSIQVAKMEGAIQAADVRVSDTGYTPAVIVVKKGVTTKIRFSVQRLSSCNYIVSFPEYGGSLDLSQGQLETPPLDVSADFRFQCGMGMLHGYVKAVDDTANVDLTAIAREVSGLIPARGRSCCSR